MTPVGRMRRFCLVELVGMSYMLLYVRVHIEREVVFNRPSPVFVVN
jgi:hypothetical protein